MLQRLRNILGLRPSTLSAPSIIRLYSVARVHGIDAKHAEALEIQRARWKHRYDNDAAFRKKSVAANSAWRKKNREKFLRILRDSSRALRQDTAYSKRLNEHTLRKYHEIYSKDPVNQHHRRLYRWARTQFDFMSTLPWKTHRPLVQETSVEHFCQGCRLAKHGGSTVWWQQLDAQDQYYCHVCYAKDVDASMPEGYEGIARWKDLVARKAELDALSQNNKSKP